MLSGDANLSPYTSGQARGNGCCTFPECTPHRIWTPKRSARSKTSSAAGTRWRKIRLSLYKWPGIKKCPILIGHQKWMERCFCKFRIIHYLIYKGQKMYSEMPRRKTMKKQTHVCRQPTTDSRSSWPSHSGRVTVADSTACSSWSTTSLGALKTAKTCGGFFSRM